MDKVLIGKLVTSRETGMTRKYMVESNVEYKGDDYIRVDGETYSINPMLPLYGIVRASESNFHLLLPYSFGKDETVAYLDAIEKLKDGEPHYVESRNEGDDVNHAYITGVFPYSWQHNIQSNNTLKSVYKSCRLSNGDTLYRNFNHQAVFVGSNNDFYAAVPSFMSGLNDLDFTSICDAAKDAHDESYKLGYQGGRKDEVEAVKKYAKILKGL